MPLPLDPVPPPLTAWPDGTVRVGRSRLLFVLVVRAYRNGLSAEGIVELYPSISAAEAYACVAYYLMHRAACDALSAEYDRDAAAADREIAARDPELAGMRERLLARERAAVAAGA